MPYEVKLAEAARADLRRLPRRWHRAVLEAAGGSLPYRPLVAGGRLKPLNRGPLPQGMHAIIQMMFTAHDGRISSEPWEISVGEYRGVYVVEPVPPTVWILGVFLKPPHLTFDDALSRWDRLE